MTVNSFLEADANPGNLIAILNKWNLVSLRSIYSQTREHELDYPNVDLHQVVAQQNFSNIVHYLKE